MERDVAKRVFNVKLIKLGDRHHRISFNSERSSRDRITQWLFLVWVSSRGDCYHLHTTYYTLCSVHFSGLSSTCRGFVVCRPWASQPASQ